jgi:hypothetical protein
MMTSNVAPISPAILSNFQAISQSEIPSEDPFPSIYQALESETDYKQQAILKKFGLTLINQNKELRESLKEYSKEYDQISENYSKILPLAEKFLNNFAQISESAPAPLKDKLIDLRNRCALFIYGQNYLEDKNYQPTYIYCVVFGWGIVAYTWPQLYNLPLSKLIAQ